MTELKCWMCGAAAHRDELGLMPIGAGDERDHVLVCLDCQMEDDDE